ncbi:MAG: endonuclease NucS domain-containing protein [Candidatus Heimdallarchaeota archaeon]
MAVFLIQVSGGESFHKETKAKQWWQEPIGEGVYIHYNWKDRRDQKDLWEKIREEDKVLVYCTGNVNPYPKQVSHVFTIKKIEFSDVPERAILHLSEKKKLSTGMPLDVIREKVDSGELSNMMGKCGIQGFNIGELEESDLETVLNWSKSIRERKEEIEVSKESDLHKYFSAYPGKIEEGIQVVDPEEALPDGAGIPDLICKDKDGKYVVIEFKAGEAKYDALGQLVSYKGAVNKKIDGEVRGIIVASSFDPKILFGAEIIDSKGTKLAEFKKYSLQFELEDM